MYQHPLFDPKFYRSQVPGLGPGAARALEHFLTAPREELADPHPLFRSQAYALGAPADAHPWLHYLEQGMAEDRSPHPLFDVEYYLRANPRARGRALAYYLVHGGDPHPLFDSAFYLSRCPEAASAPIPPLAHYLAYGAHLGFSPHPLVDEAFYRARHLPPESPLSALEHYLTHGEAQGFDPHPLFDTQHYQLQLAQPVRHPLLHYLAEGAELAPHPLFDPVFYSSHGTALQPRDNPLVHYMHHWERQPHVLFQPGFYAAAVGAPLDRNPLVHYLTSAESWRLPPHRIFDPAFYAQQHGISGLEMAPLLHFVSLGGAQGLNPNAFFDVVEYCKTHLKAAPDGVRAVTHYLSEGVRRGINPSRRFDTMRYVHSYPDVMQSGLNPLEHYLEHGQREGRLAQGTVPDVYRPVTPGHEDGMHAIVAAVAPTPAQWAALVETSRQPSQSAEAVQVVIPVHRGYAETLRCIYSAVDSRRLNQTSMRITVIEDASPDARLRRAVKDLGRLGLVRFERNAENLGFVGTVNRGMASEPESDVVLLNADTEVFGDWLDRLRVASQADSRTATVTPFSNNATICSYPRTCDENPFPLEISYEALDAMTARVNSGIRIDIPTAVGFCMYIRRACLQQVGLFDAETFGRGYAEENDFCMRAAAAGWRHVLACDVFVYHTGGVSFQAEKQAMIEKNLAILARRFPNYGRLVSDFLARDPVLPARRRIDAQRIKDRLRSDRGVVLMINHAMGGGTERHCQEIRLWLEEEGYSVAFLRPNPAQPSQLILCGQEPMLLPNLDCFDLHDDLPEPAGLLRELRVALIHVHHLAGLAEGAPEWVESLAAQAGIPYDVTLHDYMAVCPRITMVDGSGRFCGGPAIGQCQRCIKRNSSPFGMVRMSTWRRRYENFLTQARHVYVPSQDVSRRVRAYYPGVRFVLRPHPEAINSGSKKAARRRRGKTLRVAVLGAVGPHKGSTLLLDCVLDAQARELPLEFILVGYSDLPALRTMEKLRVTGAYSDDSVYALLKQHACDVALFTSVWPETYSYTFSVAVNAGLFPVAFDFGAIADRARAINWGSCLPLTLLNDPVGVNDALLALPKVLPPPPHLISDRGNLYPGGLKQYYDMPQPPRDEMLGHTDSVTDYPIGSQARATLATLGGRCAPKSSADERQDEMQAD